MSTDTRSPIRATVPGVEHHLAHVNGTVLHYVSAGSGGSPVLLVHGFPESWWTFHELIPLLAANHRVFAVDLRGFGGDSAIADDDFDSATAAEDLHQLIRHLDVDSVHVLGQDISGGAVYRLATANPGLVRTLIAVEMGLAGFGLEGFGDVTHGGSWHIGTLAAPGIADLLFAGREREVLGGVGFSDDDDRPPGSIGEEDLDEFVRVYSRHGGWRGGGGSVPVHACRGRRVPEEGCRAADHADARGRNLRRSVHRSDARPDLGRTAVRDRVRRGSGITSRSRPPRIVSPRRSVSSWTASSVDVGVCEDVRMASRGDAREATCSVELPVSPG